MIAWARKEDFALATPGPFTLSVWRCGTDFLWKIVIDGKLSDSPISFNRNGEQWETPASGMASSIEHGIVVCEQALSTVIVDRACSSSMSIGSARRGPSMTTMTTMTTCERCGVRLGAQNTKRICETCECSRAPRRRSAGRGARREKRERNLRGFGVA